MLLRILKANALISEHYKLMFLLTNQLISSQQWPPMVIVNYSEVMKSTKRYYHTNTADEEMPAEIAHGCHIHDQMFMSLIYSLIIRRQSSPYTSVQNLKL